MTLRIVPDREPEPLPYDEANAEFQAHWTAARRAYADLLSSAGNLAHPILLADGPVKRHRIEAAQYPAEVMAQHARAITEHLAICHDIFVRAEAAQKTNPATHTARTTHTKEQDQ